MNRIKELRKQHELTQEELGSIINVQKAAISKYELERATPSTDILKKLADYFNVTTDYLLGRTDEPGGFQKGDGGNEGKVAGDDDAVGGSTILMRAQSELDEDDLKILEDLAARFLEKCSKGGA